VDEGQITNIIVLPGKSGPTGPKAVYEALKEGTVSA
jgi:hypothetical protein